MNKREVLNEITTELKEKLFDNDLNIREFSIVLEDNTKLNDKYRDITICIELDDVINEL